MVLAGVLLVFTGYVDVCRIALLFPRNLPNDYSGNSIFLTCYIHVLSTSVEWLLVSVGVLCFSSACGLEKGNTLIL